MNQIITCCIYVYRPIRTFAIVSFPMDPTRLAAANFSKSTSTLASFRPSKEVKSSKVDTGCVLVSARPSICNYRKYTETYHLSNIRIYKHLLIKFISYI